MTEMNKTFVPQKTHHFISDDTTSMLEYNSSLDVFADYLPFRGTSIVCTIGPACNTLQTLTQMIKAGMKIARFNFSHGDQQLHGAMMQNVREAASQLGMVTPVALALDTKGPEIRTGINKDNAQITLKRDDIVTLTTDDAFKISCTADKIYLDYKALASSISVGKNILIADGTLVLEVTEIKGTDVVCKCVSGCTFGNRKNACLPGVKVDLPTLSEKDIQDIKFGMQQKVDIIFASFIRTGENVKELRALLNTTEHGKNIKIISKIENFEGIENIDDIIEFSDGIMAARGDLGMDISIERVITAQKLMCAKCNMKNKPLICATQMLESMITNFRPTRAEVSDVVNAVLDGSDAVMLSGETANGKYPVEAIKVMHNACSAAERMLSTKKAFAEICDSIPYMTEEQCTAMAAVSASYKIKASAIIVLSTTGRIAQLVSQFHPRCIIMMITRNEIVARQGNLYRGLFPLYYDKPRLENWAEDMDARFKYALKYALQHAFCPSGTPVIYISGWKSGSGSSNTVRMGMIGEDAKNIYSP